MEFKRVGILGAGAVGAYLVWGLSRKPGIEMYLIADGERKVRLGRDGLVINGETFRPAVKTPEEARGTDLVIVTLKSTALEDALPAVRSAADAHTVVMSPMNGVDSEEIIGSAVGPERVVHSLIKIASERKGNSVVFDPETTIGLIYGEADPARGRERTDALGRLFGGTGLHFRQTDAILSEIWAKYLINVSKNLAQAVVGCGVGAYTDSAHMAFLKQKLTDEVKAVAAAKGIDLSLAGGDAFRGCPAKPRARYSTLQDLDAGRHTEVDMFAGTLVRMGGALGVPTPYAECMWHLIKTLEEKNDGLFDYE